LRAPAQPAGIILGRLPGKSARPRPWSSRRLRRGDEWSVHVRVGRRRGVVLAVLIVQLDEESALLLELIDRFPRTAPADALSWPLALIKRLVPRHPSGQPVVVNTAARAPVRLLPCLASRPVSREGGHPFPQRLFCKGIGGRGQHQFRWRPGFQTARKERECGNESDAAGGAGADGRMELMYVSHQMCCPRRRLPPRQQHASPRLLRCQARRRQTPALVLARPLQHRGWPAAALVPRQRVQLPLHPQQRLRPR